MRILSVAQTYYPYLAGGGRPVKVRAIAEGLVARGHEVTVLTADYGSARVSPGTPDLRDRPSRFGRRGSRNGVDVIYLRTALEYRWVTLNPPLLEFCRSALRGFDVVHIYGVYDAIGPVVAAYCRRYGIPYVLEPIGMFRPISRSILVKRLYHRLLGARLAEGAAAVVATSEQERAELIEAGVAPDRVVVRRNGVAAPDVAPVRGTFRRRFGIAPDAWVVLFLGRLVRKKGPDLLVRAFARAGDRLGFDLLIEAIK